MMAVAPTMRLRYGEFPCKREVSHDSETKQAESCLLPEEAAFGRWNRCKALGSFSISSAVTRLSWIVLLAHMMSATVFRGLGHPR